MVLQPGCHPQLHAAGGTPAAAVSSRAAPRPPPLPLQPGDLLRMEGIVLDCLAFRINTPTAHTFLSMYKQALGLQPRTCALASYLAVSAPSILFVMSGSQALPPGSTAGNAGA